MNRKTSHLILGMALTVMVGLSLAGPQRGQAYRQFCEIERFYAFMAANDTYTSTFRSWYFGDPTSCTTQCTNQCNQLPTQPERDQCLSNTAACVSSCNSSRFGAFTSAQDSMITAANAPCTFDLDFCEEARSLATECGNIYAAHMANPVLDENQQIDGTWWSTVFTEFTSCRTASGIDQCE